MSATRRLNTPDSLKKEQLHYRRERRQVYGREGRREIRDEYYILMGVRERGRRWKYGEGGRMGDEFCTRWGDAVE